MKVLETRHLDKIKEKLSKHPKNLIFGRDGMWNRKEIELIGQSCKGTDFTQWQKELSNRQNI